jgi:hypothetical protein
MQEWEDVEFLRCFSQCLHEVFFAVTGQGKKYARLELPIFSLRKVHTDLG